ncbi:MAG: F0F1 ATP synthase subunit B' [Campylobacterota bacterium]|nr:F0F1 ATP synthase subunit B' [Campylobacterota bacterium]
MLDISPLMLISTLIIFLILIALLNSWLYNPLFAYMQKRDEDIANDLNEVGSNDGEVDALLKKADEIVNAAKLNAMALREKVIADTKELADSKLEATRADIASEYAKFKDSLLEERNELKSSLITQLPTYKDALKLKISQI